MAIPNLDAQGLLPVGTHDCTLDEIEMAFCWNPHRAALLSKLRDFIDQKWRPLAIPASFWVDGSFTRKIDTPKDIDVVADMSGASDQQAWPGIQLWFQNDQIKQDYSVDFWPKHPLYPLDLSAFFCYAGTKAAAELGIDSKQIKGILRITL